jgi:hypothetical protein
MAPQIAMNFDFKRDSKKTGKPKSTAFEAVQDALDDYIEASTATNLLALTRALGAWKVAKKNGAATWTSSIRVEAVRELDAWIILESEAIGIFPTSRTNWGGDHNCYAYSMNCLAPQGSGYNSWPGKFAGIATGGNFAQGVVDDGAAQGVTIQILRQAGMPTPVPAPLGGGHYLVAMVANAMGYHFLRRNDATGLWTHKNGSASPVETHFYDNAIEQPVAITDVVIAQILATPALISCSMTFNSYLSVPVPGITVKG